MFLDISPSLPVPLPTQIAQQIRLAVAEGTLQPGDTVSSTRALAQQLGVSRGTVVSAYDQLISEGFFLSTQGAPTRVHPELKLAPAAQGQRRTGVSRKLPRARISLRPSAGSNGAVRPAAWRKAWREAINATGASLDKTGEPELKAAIAEHLRLARGVNVDVDQVVITGGSREGLLLILHALGPQLRVGVEDPGHPGLRRVIPLGGHKAVPCATNAGGVEVDELPGDLDALLVTPSHLYPFGGAMSAARRSALLNWASTTGAVLIEDDFNTELRYLLSPQPTLATLSPGAAVLTLGTFSTLLSRELSAGYVIAPPALAPALRSTREVLGMPVATVTQRAIAYLLVGGYLRRSTRAAHNRLSKRRVILAETLVPVLEKDGVSVTAPDAGGADLSVTFSTPELRDRFEEDLAGQGIECGHESSLWSDGHDGLVLSFSHLTDPDFDLALTAVTAAASRLSADSQAQESDLEHLLPEPPHARVRSSEQPRRRRRP